MRIFSTTQKFMWLFGFLYTFERQWYTWYNYLINFSNCSLFLQVNTFFFQNILDVSLMTETMSLSTGEINAMAKGFIFIYNRDRIKHLIIDLQRTVDTKERLGRLKHYLAMDKRDTFWCRLHICMMAGSVYSVSLGPISSVLYHYFLGDLTPDMYRQPVGLVFPFDHYQSPYYGIVYIQCLVVIPVIGFTMGLVDCLFMSACSQVIACQKDLQDMLREIPVDDGVHYRERSNDGVTRQIIECAKFHNEIYCLIDAIRAIYSPVIFTQFTLSVLQLCTLVFQFQGLGDMAVDRAVSNVFTVTVAMMELFLYCYYGNEVMFQGVAISDAAYDSGWHRCSPKQRRYISFIMMNANKAQIFMGCKLVKCTMSSFTSILNMVGSALALLQSVV